ncbi:prepilin-type N-terminal cleavage/methylation domain-containing protein [Polaromonas sp. YR568]|uniref:type II secretion system protein n=1 Tax=Polaromonas sp. YR568 TaxID=1855301 RepID=UPI003137905E
MKTFKKQAGFTLVEIAIVLVIVGLLLAGVLKGQELIESSRAKNLGKDMDAIAAGMISYTDRFKRIPGDDGPLATLTARGGNWATVTAFGNNDGILTILQANTFTAVGEGVAFFQHLKAAGFITGNPADAGIAALPRSAYNGLISVGPGVTGMTGSSVCASQVPGKAARALDTMLDDGVTDGGSFRATLGVVGANTAPGAAVLAANGYIDTNIYTICKTM